MGRKKRAVSSSGIYHVISRGNGKQYIFHDDQDFSVFKNYLKSALNLYDLVILSYCLMGNHLHLLVQTEDIGEMSWAMHYSLGKYAGYYNAKYERAGSLFASRFKSIPVICGEYFFCVVKYIHNNPVKAGLVGGMADYKWSSYGEILRGGSKSLVEYGALLAYYGSDSSSQKEDFVYQHHVPSLIPDELIEDYPLTEAEQLKVFGGGYDLKVLGKAKSMEQDERDALILGLKIDAGLTNKAIERLTGISVVIIKNVCLKFVRNV
ncbi:MAG: transposase [Clostridiales bacterium]|nr:transposase [Clostridiales bacterium]